MHLQALLWNAQIAVHIKDQHPVLLVRFRLINLVGLHGCNLSHTLSFHTHTRSLSHTDFLSTHTHTLSHTDPPPSLSLCVCARVSVCVCVCLPLPITAAQALCHAQGSHTSMHVKLKPAPRSARTAAMVSYPQWLQQTQQAVHDRHKYTPYVAFTHSGI